MFSPTEDQSRTPRQWRTALRNAAELVVAFATLDSYPLPKVPHDSPVALDAPLVDLDGEWTWSHPESRVTPRAPRQRQRGAGVVPPADSPCLVGAARSPRSARTVAGQRAFSDAR